jgi:hypothetical protein
MKLTLIVLSVFLSTQTATHAANRLLYENFNDKQLDPRLTAYDRSWNVLAPPKYNLTAVGRAGSGNCFSSGTVSGAFLCWVKEMPKPWPTDQFYVSFWMRYPTYKVTDRMNENFKIFYPHWNGASSYVHFAMAQPNSVYYSAMGKGAMLAYGRWLNCPNMTDGKWHRYEFYVCFSKGISQFKYDGVLLLDDEYGTGKWTRDMYYFSVPSIDAEEPGVFSRQVDDFEIWDGVPAFSLLHISDARTYRHSEEAGSPRVAAGDHAYGGYACRAVHEPIMPMRVQSASVSWKSASPLPGYSSRLPVIASSSLMENIMRR